MMSYTGVPGDKKTSDAFPNAAGTSLKITED